MATVLRRLRTTGNLVAHQLPTALRATALLGEHHDGTIRGLDELDALTKRNDDGDDLRDLRFLRAFQAD
jgi:hypothetical protein